MFSCSGVKSFVEDLLEVLEDRIAVKSGFYAVYYEVKLCGYLNKSE